MYQYGVDSSLFDKNELYHGLATGVVIFAIWYFIRSAVVSLLFKVIKKKTVEKSKNEQTQEQNLNENTSKETVSEADSELKELKTENKEEIKNSEKIEPVFGNEEKANPHLFDNLKLNR